MKIPAELVKGLLLGAAAATLGAQNVQNLVTHPSLPAQENLKRDDLVAWGSLAALAAAGVYLNGAKRSNSMGRGLIIAAALGAGYKVLGKGNPADVPARFNVPALVPFKG